MPIIQGMLMKQDICVRQRKHAERQTNEAIQGMKNGRSGPKLLQASFLTFTSHCMSPYIGAVDTVQIKEND